MSVQNFFSPKASRIVRVLLVSPEKERGILNLSDKAGTAYGHTYRAIETLLELGLCRKTEANREKLHVYHRKEERRRIFVRSQQASVLG